MKCQYRMKLLRNRFIGGIILITVQLFLRIIKEITILCRF